MSYAKPFARGIDELTLHVFRGSESDAVNQTVKNAVLRLQFFKKFRDLLVGSDVAHESCRAGQIGDQVLGLLLKPLILVRDSQAPARLMKLLGDSPGDAAL